jgi:uncharacterized protein (TIGR02118 family)
MIRVLALHGQPIDESSYTGHYIDVHMPIVQRIPGLRNIRFGRVLETADGKPPPYYLVSDVYFDDMEALEKALVSPEMQEAFADVPNFATGGVTIMFCETTDIPPTPLADDET